MQKHALEGGTAALERGLVLMKAIVSDGGCTSLSDIARDLDLPDSSSRRIAGALERQGMIVRVSRGRYVAGPALVGLAVNADLRTMLVQVSRPYLRALARDVHATVHLGVFEDDMVTYLIKERGGGPKLYTQEGMQLEAYCTAIGKMLLARLPNDTRDAYVATGPFVALTDRTVTDPDAIHHMLLQVRTQGYAEEIGEISDDIRCLAVPVEVNDGRALAAISLTRPILGNSNSDGVMLAEDLAKLRAQADAISARINTGMLASAPKK